LISKVVILFRVILGFEIFVGNASFKIDVLKQERLVLLGYVFIKRQYFDCIVILAGFVYN